MKRKLLTTFYFLFFITISAQETSEILPEEANARYFETPRETLYVHLNKSTYLNGEEIWFKAYAYDRKNSLPSRFTTNFNIELYNDKYEEVYSGLFLGYQGSAKGNIKINTKWPSGDYYVRMTTNWMNNFIEDDAYTQKIKIVNQPIVKPTKAQSNTYDFQLLPEGGHIVSDTDNTIGFKLVNNLGHGISFENGTVIDNQGNRVALFKSNQFGIGKFSFKPQLNRHYTAVIKLNNQQEISTSFPEIKKKGIAITINNLYKDNIIIEFNTNTITLNESKDKNYYLLIHQNHLSKKTLLDFTSNQTKKGVYIKRKQLYPGMNTITLFENNTPVLERLLFNPLDKTEADIKITHQSTFNDSLLLMIKMPKNDNVIYDLSISVLPEETKSYNYQDNIRSAMLLNPYVKGFIENPKYYFTASNRRKIYDLDLLLITQGWSRYSWNTIFNQQPEIYYEFNNGLIIKGKLQSTKSIEQVYLYPTNNNSSRLIDLDNEGTFTIKNYYPNKGERIGISGIKSNGKLSKIPMYIQTQHNRYKKPFSLPNTINADSNVLYDVLIPDSFYGDLELLGEVKIIGKKRQKKKTSGFLIGKSREISETDAKIYNTILDYLTQVVGVRLDLNAVAQTDPTLTESPDILANTNAPAIYLDDIQLIDFGILLSIPTRDVENVYYDRSGFGGSNAEVRIYSRRTFFNGTPSKGIDSKVSEYTFNNGFKVTKEFYNPIYGSYQDPFFKDYGTIHWQPFVNFDEAGTGIFKIPDTFVKNIKLYIEGVGSDGDLISTVETIHLN